MMLQFSHCSFLYYFQELHRSQNEIKSATLFDQGFPITLQISQYLASGVVNGNKDCIKRSSSLSLIVHTVHTNPFSMT